MQFVKDNDFQAALIEFRRAYEVAPNYRILYNIAQAYGELQNYAQSLKTFEAYLRDGAKEISSDRRRAVEKEIEKLRLRVGYITIKVSREQAEVFLDDVTAGKSPLSEPLVANVGRHKISATFPGTFNDVRYLELASGDRAEISLTLNDIPAEKPAAFVPEAPRPATSSDRPSGSRRRGITPVVGVLGGLGVGAIGAFAYLSLSGTSDRNQLRETCAPRCSPSEVDAARRKVLIGDISLGVGAAALGVATFLFFSHPKSPGEGETKREAFDVVPMPGGALGTMRKHF